MTYTEVPSSTIDDATTQPAVAVVFKRTRADQVLFVRGANGSFELPSIGPDGTGTYTTTNCPDALPSDPARDAISAGSRLIGYLTGGSNLSADQIRLDQAQLNGVIDPERQRLWSVTSLTSQDFPGAEWINLFDIKSGGRFSETDVALVRLCQKGPRPGPVVSEELELELVAL